MPLATVSTVARPVAAYRPLRLLPTLHHLRRMQEQWRERRLDRMVAATVQALDHAGIAEDYRAATRRW